MVTAIRWVIWAFFFCGAAVSFSLDKRRHAAIPQQSISVQLHATGNGFSKGGAKRDKKKQKPSSLRTANNSKKGFGRSLDPQRRAAAAAVPSPTPRHLLLDSLCRLPGAAVGPIELRKSKCGDGVGAYLTGAVVDGQALFKVPSAGFLSVSTALAHPLLGPACQELWSETALDDPKGTSVLAALVAHLQLNRDDEEGGASFGLLGPYLDMLPQQQQDEALNTRPHALWWTEAETALLVGSHGYEDWVDMRQDVAEMSSALRRGVLAGDVAKHGDEKVDDAVRDAFVAVLSRAYAVHSSSSSSSSDGGSGDRKEFKALIPLLDALNHAPRPNVVYAFEGSASHEGRGMEGVLVARAVGALEPGEELTISYGDHPDHIFGLYWGFVLPSPSFEEAAETNSGGSSSSPPDGRNAAVRPFCKSMAHALLLSDTRATEEIDT